MLRSLAAAGCLAERQSGSHVRVRRGKCRTTVPDIELTHQERTVTAGAHEAKTRADAAQALAQAALTSAARQLTSAGFSRRDAAFLLGLSHQRIQQLLDRT